MPETIHLLILKTTPKIEEIAKSLKANPDQLNQTFDHPPSQHKKYEGFTPLYLAILKNNSKIVEFLLSQEKINIFKINNKNVDKDWKPLFSVMKKDFSSRLVKKILDQYKKNQKEIPKIPDKKYGNMTALMYSVYGALPNTVEALALFLKENGRGNELELEGSYKGHTPLSAAIEIFEHEEIKDRKELAWEVIYTLLKSFEFKIDIFHIYLDQIYNEKLSFLRLLVRALPFNKLEKILNAYKIPITDSRVISYAADSNFDTFKELLKQKNLDVNAPIPKGQLFEGANPLLLATMKGNIETIKFLIETEKLDLDYYCATENICGNALEIAISKGNFELVRLLVNKKANVDSVHYVNRVFESPIIEAANYNNQEILLFLLENSAFKNKNGITEAIEQARLSALISSIGHRNEKMFDLLLPLIPNVNTTLKESFTKVDFEKGNHTRCFGISSLQYCIVNRRPLSFIEKLIIAGVQVDKVWSDSFYKEFTPLILAVFNSRQDLFAIFIKHGANPYSKFYKGESAITSAIKLDDEVGAMLLIQLFAKLNPNAKVSEKQNNELFEMAALKRHLKLAKLLIKQGAKPVKFISSVGKELENDQQSEWIMFISDLRSEFDSSSWENKDWNAELSTDFWSTSTRNANNNAEVAAELVPLKVLQGFYKNFHCHSIFLHYAIYELELLEKALADEKKYPQSVVYIYCIKLRLMRFTEAMLKYFYEAKDDSLFPPNVASTIRNSIMHISDEISSAVVVGIAQSVAKEMNERIKLFLEKKPLSSPLVLECDNNYKLWLVLLKKWNTESKPIEQLASLIESQLMTVCENNIKVLSSYKLKIISEVADCLRMQFAILGEFSRYFKSEDDFKKLMETLMPSSSYDESIKDKLIKFVKQCQYIRGKIGHEFSEDKNEPMKMSDVISVEYLYLTLVLARDIAKAMKPEIKPLVGSANLI